VVLVVQQVLVVLGMVGGKVGEVVGMVQGKVEVVGDMASLVVVEELRSNLVDMLEHM